MPLAYSDVNRFVNYCTLAPQQRVSQSVNKPDRKKRRATLEQLEARTLFSADIMSAVMTLTGLQA